MKHRKSRTETITIRGLRYNVRQWGEEGAPKVFFLHGWMDCSPTFQFLVDALQQSWHVIAPDWRGYGDSEWLSRPYLYADYLADLSALLAHYSPGVPARIVAHSMGANIAATYAGLRPKRVRQLVMLDFLGLKPPLDDDAPTVLGRWLRYAEAGPPRGLYANSETLANRLMELDPRLSEERAAFLAWNIGRMRSDGTVEMACDPWHRVPAPTVYRIEDAMACWRRVEAPVLLVVAGYGLVNKRLANDPDEFQRRLACFRDLRLEPIEDSGHNVQHDQPELAAAAIEAFLSRED